MYRIFQHKNGILYLKIDTEDLKGIFYLQIVNNPGNIINFNHFEDEVKKNNIREYTLLPEFEDIPIELYEADMENDRYDNDNLCLDHTEESSVNYANYTEEIEFENDFEADDDCDYSYDCDYDVPPGYMDDCPPDVDPDVWREYYTGG